MITYEALRTLLGVLEFGSYDGHYVHYAYLSLPDTIVVEIMRPGGGVLPLTLKVDEA